VAVAALKDLPLPCEMRNPQTHRSKAPQIRRKGREFPVYWAERRRQKENAFMRSSYCLFYFLFYFLGPSRNAHSERLDAREPA
jgi:hypothetical protein